MLKTLLQFFDGLQNEDEDVHCHCNIACRFHTSDVSVFGKVTDHYCCLFEEPLKSTQDRCGYYNAVRPKACMNLRKRLQNMSKNEN